MSTSCRLTGHTWLNGNNVSHSNRKTKRRFMPNLHNLTLKSDLLDRSFKLKITSKTLRTIDFKGGFDNFLLNTKNSKLTKLALRLKKQVAKLASLKDATEHPKTQN